MKTERITRRDMIDRLFEHGECVLWEGQPNPGAWFRMGVRLAAVGAFVLLWPIGAYISLTSFDLITIIALAFFFLCGSALMLAPFLGWFAARRTFYAVTDRRVILCTPKLGRQFELTSLFRSELTLLIRHDSRGRSGSLRFERYNRNVAMFGGGGPILSASGLCSIDDARMVEAVIREQFLTPNRLELDPQISDSSGLIDPILSRLLEGELGDDEHIVWAQRPNARCMFKKALPIGLFGFFWLCFLIVFLFEAHQQSLSGTAQSWVVLLAVLIFIGIFLAVGLGLLLSPAWFWCSARRTTYAMTNQRCLIVKASAGRKRRVTSFFPPEMEYIWRVEAQGGYGDVVFGRADQAQGQKSTERLAEECGFIAIENPAEIERLIRQSLAQREAAELS